MRAPRRDLILLIALAIAVGAGAAGGSQGRPATGSTKPALILISADGFRADYLDRFETPALGRLMQSGVRAQYLVPVFPTKTYPNHYTIVTGLYPDHHGIILNEMFDPLWGRRFDRRAVGRAEYDEWWDGEPIWVTARQQGLRSSTMFWPGSDAEIHGVRPHDWLPYDGSLPNQARVDRVLSWLDRTADNRPSVITLYLSDTDDVGHRVGPDSTEVGDAIRRIDSAIGALLSGLESRKLAEATDVMVVSDHGVAQTSPERVIVLDDLIALADVDVSDWTPVLSLWPKPGRAEAVFEKLRGAHPHLAVYRAADLPPRWHLGTHRRVPPIVAIADEGWTITTREQFAKQRQRWDYGNHGYDSALESMRAIFIARGPHFRRGVTVPPVENIHLYELMCRILDLQPAPNDGRLSAVAHVLSER